MAEIYAMKENLTPADLGPFPVSMDEALRLNQSGEYGIFRCVNEFNGRRLKSNLIRIRAWHVDIDGDKKLALYKIKNSPIYPSRVVESKNGFHVYFTAINADPIYHPVIEKGLLEYFGGDGKAAMLTVLLREPGFLHKKDPKDPFMVREIFKIDTRYTDADMLYFFPITRPRDLGVTPDEAKKLNMDVSKLTDFLDNLDHEVALTVLSGSKYVNYETYTFKPVPNNHKNIYVNGRSSSCFIDARKMIGAVPGGPTVFQWLRYFNHSNTEIYRILKEFFGGEV